MMDFELFNDVSSNADMDMSNCGVSGLMSADGSSPPDSMMLSLDEEDLLSSFGDNSKPLTSPGNGSTDCFYFIPELNSTCSLMNPNDLRDEGIDSSSKLFLKNGDSGLWVFADKQVGNMGAAPRITTTKNYLETPVKSQFLTGHIIEPPLQPFKRPIQKQVNTSLTPENDAKDYGRSTMPTATRKRKVETTPSSKSSENEKSSWDEFQLSKPSAARSGGIKKVATKVTTTTNNKVLTEDFLKTLTDSITQQISNTVRQEIHLAMDSFKTYFDEKFEQAANKSTTSQHSCQPKESGDEESLKNNRNVNQQEIEEITIQDDTEVSIHYASQEEENHNIHGPDSKLQYGETSKSGDTKSKKIHEAKTFHTDSKDFHIGKLAEPKSPSVDVSHNEMFEQSQIAAVNTSYESQIETPKKSNSHDNNLIPTELIVDISTIPKESKSMEIDHTFAFGKGMAENKSLLGANVKDESSKAENPVDLLIIKDVRQVLEDQQTEIKVENEENTIIVPVPDEPCTAIVPYVSPLSPKTGATTPRKREQVPKPELALRKYKKPLICEVCNRSFLNNSSLRQHMSFHKPQRPYLCSQQNCEKSYKTRSELNRHLVVHTGQKNYECRKCGKSFLRKQYLKTHLIRHNEGLTWQCTLCSKIFVSEEDLSKHKVSYHKNGKRSSLLMIAQPEKLAITYHLEDSLEA